MRTGRIAISLFFPLTLCAGLLYGQGVPFLRFPASPDQVGMGGILTAIPSQHSMAAIGNSAQLGLFTQDNFLSAGLYAPKTDRLPQYNLSGLTFNTMAVNAGHNLRDLLGLPVSFGAGYSRIYLDFGKFTLTNPYGPMPIGTFEGYDKSEQLSFGLGIDYGIRVGLGMSHKWVESSLAPVGAEVESSTTGYAKANDFGMMVQLPVIRVASALGAGTLEIVPGLKPLFDLNLGVAERNRGDRLTYSDAASADLLPRTASVGASVELGLDAHVWGTEWNLFSFLLAREAEQLLIAGSGTSADYISGFGQIQFVHNVLEGHSTDLVDVRRGWQLHLAECVYIRGGSVSGAGDDNSTSGFGIRLSGILKCLAFFSAGDVDRTWLGWALGTIDLQYDHASYGDPAGSTFGSVNLVLKKTPW